MQIRIGILGMGFMGNCHFNAYQNVKRARVAALCDCEPGKLKAGAGVSGNIGAGGAAKNLAGIRTYADAGRLLADPEIDVVDITLPTYLHAEWAIKALEAGKHVICEKPMAISSDAARRMCAAARKARRLLFIGHCIRFWPAYAVAREIVHKGVYGKVHSAVFYRISPRPVWSWKNWLMNPRLSGNAALDLHIHDADFVLYLFGRPKAVCSHGSGSARAGFEHIVTAYDFGAGQAVIAEGGWGFETKHPFSMTFRVGMAKASLALHADGKLRLYKPRCAPEEVKVPAGDGYGQELEHFVECIAASRQSKIVTPESAMESVRLVEAEIKSAASGKKNNFKTIQ